MGSWYWIGVGAGIGAAVGLLSAGFVGSRAAGAVGAAAAAVAGFFSAWPLGGWWDAGAGTIGAVVVSISGAIVVLGARRRGGTRGGTAAIVAGSALLAGGLAFVPGVGYLEPLALLAVALRLLRTRPERYAGLRTLARD
jgi:hypothetical protein